ncbi:hypothetical protein AeMF1_006423 [Aphanomyces euteiches]|nr:hypothetical protein AeMF1_006423 [Aphanomyces euteiches]KAH9184819.1 hypothetical protein AeNC1_013204 [Aphanomyces euteiches]
MKKARCLAPLKAGKSWSELPLEIIIKIAFSIPDAKDVMSFLEALRPHVDLGPLDHLTQLDLTNNASNIWPTLKPEKDVQRKFVGHECILQHYTAIEVNHNFDIEWIKKHMNASAWVHWETVNRFFSMDSLPIIQTFTLRASCCTSRGLLTSIGWMSCLDPPT